MRPPGIKEAWEDNAPWFQAQIIAYSQLRDHEEMELLSAMNGKAK